MSGVSLIKVRRQQRIRSLAFFTRVKPSRRPLTFCSRRRSISRYPTGIPELKKLANAHVIVHKKVIVFDPSCTPCATRSHPGRSRAAATLSQCSGASDTRYPARRSIYIRTSWREAGEGRRRGERYASPGAPGSCGRRKMIAASRGLLVPIARKLHRAETFGSAMQRKPA